MADIEVDEETIVVSDLSEGLSSEDDSGYGGGLSPERPIRGVRNGVLPFFVTKLYEVVTNKDTDSIISWVSNLNVGQTVYGGATSFAIWNETDFINNILPLMSNSKNFDSFTTQLNNYGFKKISWNCREYANEWFIEGKPHLLKNIKRKGKSNTCETEKLAREINKFESDSKKLDHELRGLKEYMDNIVSINNKILCKPYQRLSNRPLINIMSVKHMS